MKHKVNYGVSNRDPLKRIHVLESRADPELYDMAARHDLNSAVRKYSLQKLAGLVRMNDGYKEYAGTIADASVDDRHPEVRRFALNLLDNTASSVSTIKYIALNDRSAKNRKRAAERLAEAGDSEAVMGSIALYDRAPDVRAEAAKHVKDEQVLQIVIRKDPNDEVRAAAGEAFTALVKMARRV